MLVPLLQLAYTVNRMIVITHPQLIHKYCTKRVTCIVTITFVFITMAISIYELYENIFMFFGASFERKFIEIEKQNELYRNSGVLNICMFLSIFFVVYIGTLFLTKKMNRSMQKNIDFLKTMDAERHNCRIFSYENVIRFNKIIAITTLMFTLIHLLDTLIRSLKFFLLREVVSEGTRFQYYLKLVELSGIFLGSLEVCISPLVFILFLPSVRQSLNMVRTKILSVITWMRGT